ncbi:MAG: LysM peptidoglycan-binding domain-containing protein [Akkermansia sp.]|nr:LysM peptidoglycan-binding domain-containing protein [Akkermansia sp.]
MKKSLSILGLGVGMLATLSSCSNVYNGDTLGYEEAMPMSEMAIGDSELPPWVLEGDDSYQIPAGDRTPEVADRNHFATPEPGESMAVSNGLTSQNQPAIAHDDTVLDSHVSDDFDPYAMPTTPATPTGSSAVATTTPKPAQQIASVNKPKKTGTQKKTQQQKAKKVSEPTLVVYKVRPGDNLYEIAKRSNTTIAQIRKDSGIKGDLIHPGDIIKVRFTPKGYKASKNKATPTTTTYVVKKGDMLSKVAARNGVTLAALLKANNMTMAQANKVRPGTKIVIPGKTSTVSKKTNTSTKKNKRR